MNIEQIKEKLKSEEYDFLRTDPHLGNNIILLGLGGSHAYGTNIETSDLDVRGCAINSKIEILTNVNFEQCCNETKDTTIYSIQIRLNYLDLNLNIIYMFLQLVRSFLIIKICFYLKEQFNHLVVMHIVSYED